MARTEPRHTGPGLVYALAVIGAGDFVSNAAIGVAHGYSLLWALAIAVAGRWIWVGASARYVLATGETLAAGFARVSVGYAWFLLVVMVLHRHVHGLYHILFMGTSVQLLAPLPFAGGARIWSLLFVAAGFSMIFWSGYKSTERAFKLIMAVMGASLILAAILSRPRLADVAHGLMVPSLSASGGLYATTLLLAALLGTEACTLSNITYSYFIWQKGWRDMSHIARQKMDLLVSVAAMFLVGAMIQIAAGSVAGREAIQLSNIEDLVRLFSEKLGWTGRAIFALGIWAAVFTSYVGGITGYALVITDICRSSVPSLRKPGTHSRDDLRRDPIFRWFVIFAAFSPLYILWVPVRPVGLVLAASAAVTLIVPAMAVAMLILMNQRERMGEHRATWWENAALGLMAALAAYFSVVNGLELLKKLGVGT
jgi:Mn2+/Fe2+ NRAMP family transporter